MGTNYYATFIVNRTDFEGTQYKTREQLHIGKTSGGWVFSWHGYKEDVMPDYLTAVGVGNIVTVNQWLGLLETGPLHKIEDDYGQEWSVTDFVNLALGWNKGNVHALMYRGPDQWTDTYLGNIYSFSAGDWC